MGNLHSGEQKNNLELYLNDVFEKECEFKIEQEEIQFIQTGIETLVQMLVDLTLTYVAFEKRISDQIDEYDAENVLNNGKQLDEVFVPIPENLSDVNIAESTIIKVGSFYDGTKNNFPDEFDFIFPVLGFKTYRAFKDVAYEINRTVEESIKQNGNESELNYSNARDHTGRTLYFDKYIGRHGPAFEMQFIYINGSGEQIPIHVDLVPAYKLIGCNTQQRFLSEVNEFLVPELFREEILSARNSLYINRRLAFTEIEQQFMKNVLSKKHVKVTRVLKHLLNGNGDGEKLEKDIRHQRGCMYTSYRIKILMIHHHETCTNIGTEDLGPCVLQILNEMSSYEFSDMFPSFTKPSPLHYLRQETFELLPHLISSIKTLLSMRTSAQNYNYERVKIKSVSGQYLDMNKIPGPQPRKTNRDCVIL